MSALTRFEACYAELLEIEGGYSNRKLSADPGGPTMNGVTWQTYNAYRDVKGLPRRDVREMEPHERRNIYWGQYWRAAGCEHLPAGLDFAVFDFAVHSGPVTAIRHLQRTLGVNADGHYGMQTYGAIRQSYIPALIQGLMEQRRGYGRRLKNYPQNQGWENRWRRVEASALAAAGAQAWAASITYTATPQDPDVRSAEQSRALPQAPTPPVTPEILLGGSGAGTLPFTLASIAQRSVVDGRFSPTAFLLALAFEPLVWMAAVSIGSAVWVYLWRRQHAQ
jgi:lysozyme family protein